MGPGTALLGGRYELRSLLATGGMGQVWRGRDTLLDRDVAVKVLRSEYTRDRSFLERFRAEARHTAALSHPNIATLHDYGETEAVGPGGGEHVAWLVMELVEGESLADLLARESPLDPARVAGLLRQAAAGLGAAHEAGVVHRDVKPGNVLVRPDGVVKITDFGIAWSASSVALTGTGQVVGTAHYLSPEQASGGPATPASDVYALGLVAYECLAGRRAFEGENSVQVALKQIREEPPPLPAGVPAPWQALVGRALAKDPARRPADGDAFRDAVDGLSGGPGVPGPARAATAAMPAAGAVAPAAGAVGPAATRVLPSGPPRAAAPSSGRGGRRRGLLLAVLALLAVAAVIGVALSSGGDPTPATEQTPGPVTAPITDPRVEVVAEDLVGRPVAVVQGELAGQGFAVALVPVERSDVPDGQVTAVAPSGPVAPGSTLTVTHAVAPPPTETGGGNGSEEGADEDEGGGNGNEGGGNGNEGGGNGDEGGGNGNEGGGNGTTGRDG
ncbi:serine/threonine-protein kinase [Geodermatophilus poikilotrophus]|uniref:non-specific serine/threonine protein kinase n=1 Tax=Geodermatophilus poikilotrophus TaxID=1333667 RepID=A0A1I0D8K0_9ACTN|nr:serine/threonine-protein kinase [Geodermatophilus poikilotrophus]SET28568.1 serine/threonine protein kinase [Geodermatophilus poikilotrophus]